MNWNDFFISMARLVANKSKDRSTRVGAVIVGPDNEVRSVGYNGFPRNVDDEDSSRHERPTKYRYTEHAERNAIYNAARVGIPTQGCDMYLNWEPCPCTDCTRAIIQSGIKRVIGPDIIFPGVSPHWSDDMKDSAIMLQEAGVEVVRVKVPSTESVELAKTANAKA